MQYSKIYDPKMLISAQINFVRVISLGYRITWPLKELYSYRCAMVKDIFKTRAMALVDNEAQLVLSRDELRE